MLTVVLKRDIKFVMFHQNDLKAEIDMHTTLNNFFKLSKHGLKYNTQNL